MPKIAPHFGPFSTVHMQKQAYFHFLSTFTPKFEISGGLFSIQLRILVALTRRFVRVLSEKRLFVIQNVGIWGTVEVEANQRRLSIQKCL